MAHSFAFQEKLGEGHFGEVWYAIDEGLDVDVALKCIPTDKIINQDNFFQEAQILKVSEHPNIVAVNEAGNLKDGRIYVSMEFLPNGSLEDEAQGAPVTLPRVKKLMIDVLRGLGYAHSKGVVHRDIKPANILIGNTGEGKLSDFGLALPNIENLDVSQLKQYQYIAHLAPEVRKLTDYTHLADIYACGITLYRMVNGNNYLPKLSLKEIKSLAKKGEFPSRDKYREFVPSNLKRLINKALNVDPSKRYQSADEMRHALESKVIDIGWMETVVPNQIRWDGVDGKGRIVEVVKAKGNNHGWTIETKRGSSRWQLRRIGHLCFSGLKKKDADKQVRRILQDLVLQKI